MKISGNVIPTPNKLRSSIGRLRLDKTKFSFKNLKNTEVMQGEIKLHNTYKEIVHVTFENNLDYLQIIPSKIDLKPDERTSIKYIFEAGKKQEFGNFIEKIPLSIKTISKSNRGYIYFTGSILEDFSTLTPEQKENAPVLELDSHTIDLGEIDLDQNKIVEIPVYNKGGSELIIRKIETTRYCRLIDHENLIIPGGQGKIIIEINPKLRRKNFYTDFTIISNDPEQSVVRIRISGHLVN